MATKSKRKFPDGFVQLNIRVPVELDNKVRALADAGKRTITDEWLERMALSIKDRPKLS